MSLRALFRFAAASLVLMPCAGQQAKEASRPDTIALQQVQIDLPSIRVYADVLDADGNPVAGLATADFKAAAADRWIPFRSVQPFRSTGEGVAYSMLIDVSLSSQSRFAEMKKAVTPWIDNLQGNDRMQLIKIGDKPEAATPFTADHATLAAALNAMSSTARRTALYASILAALHSFDSVDLPRRRAIVVLTDGMDDDDLNGQTLENVFSAIDQQKAPIFAIGVTAVPPPPNADDWLTTLSRIAVATNGIYLPLGDDPIESLYEKMHQAILRVYVGSLLCPSCPHDGRTYGFTVDVRGKDSSTRQIVFSPPVKDGFSPMLMVGLGLLALALLAVAAWLLIRARRKKPVPEPAPEELQVWVPPQPAMLPIPQPLPAPLPSRAHVKISLVAVDKLDRKIRHEVDLLDHIVIGCDPSNDIRLSGDNSVAAHHCEIYRSEGVLLVRDLSGGGRTAVNGVPIRQQRRIEDNDLLRIGNTDFRVLFGAPS